MSQELKPQCVICVLWRELKCGDLGQKIEGVVRLEALQECGDIRLSKGW
jgi:hypothetical protein